MTRKLGRAETTAEIVLAVEDERNYPGVTVTRTGKKAHIRGPVTYPIEGIDITPNCRSLPKAEKNNWLRILAIMGITAIVILLIIGTVVHAVNPNYGLLQIGIASVLPKLFFSGL